MSLLLDALKKAAADKEKSEGLAPEKPDELDAKASKEDELPAIDEEVYQTPEIDEELIAGNQSEDNGNEDVAESLDLELDDDFELADENEADVETIDEAQTVEADSLAETVDEIDSEPAVSSEAEVIEQPEPVDKEQIEIVQAGKAAAQNGLNEAANAVLPEYNHNDARKILEVSQKRFRNQQRILYYGMYVFAALLFFIASYLYYTTEALDNSSLPRFKPNVNTTNINSTKSSIQPPVDDKPVVAKASQAQVKNSQQTVKTKQTTAKAKAVVPTKKITIVKQNKPDPISLLLQRAYKAYQSGQYQQAESLYQQVLRRDAKQRDALLGRAAIAVVNKEVELAKSYYQQVLHLYPKDSIAKSALVDLVKKELSVANESQLNILLRENPSAAHVHFSLGLLYARQKRLKESQQAFFDAYSLEKKADYAYNLAVMLDKLSQPKAALSYYKKASELSDNSVIHFSEKSVLERIEQLEAKHE